VACSENRFDLIAFVEALSTHDVFLCEFELLEENRLINLALSKEEFDFLAVFIWVFGFF